MGQERETMTRGLRKWTRVPFFSLSFIQFLTISRIKGETGYHEAEHGSSRAKTKAGRGLGGTNGENNNMERVKNKPQWDQEQETDF
jgi:hypothetical protein